MNLLNNINDAVQEELTNTGFDANIEQQGGGNFERVILEDGIYPGYLCEYVDYGTQKFNGFQGAKDTFDKAVHLGVVVFDFENTNEDGSPRHVVLGTGMFPLKVSLNPKAKFRKIFKAFNYNNDPTKKHFAQFLGPTHSFNFKVHKRKSKDGKSEYNVLDFDSATPCMTGDLGKRTRAVLPQIAEKDFALLLWNSPSKAQWDSIRRGVEDISPLDDKNFHQYKVLQATDFEGSAVDIMLHELGVDMVTPPAKDPNHGSKNEVKTQAETQPSYDDDVPFDTGKEPVTPDALPVMPEGLD